MQRMNENLRPTAVLKAEHQIILRVIRILGDLVERSRSGAGFERESLARCVQFFKLFADACHHAKEENLLFPVLEQRGIPRDGGPIGVMLYEHSVARQLTRQMESALEQIDGGDSAGVETFHEAAGQYIALLTNHIHKEDNILFVMGDSSMREDDQTALCGRFCEVGCQSFGGQTRDQLEQIADDLERAWPPS